MKETFTREEILTTHNRISTILKQDYFDLRIELVDHILNDIEEKSESKSKQSCTFFALLNESIEKLGSSKGIRKIAFDRKYELWKKYLIDHIQAFIRTISWPHILISAVTIFMFYNLLSSVENYIWIFLLCSMTTGLIEMIDRWGSRGWINDFGSTLTIFPIYSRSAFLTNWPLVLLIPGQFSELFLLNEPWIGQLLASLGLFIFLVFFIFRFYELKKGVRQEIKKYRIIHQQLIGVA